MKKLLLLAFAIICAALLVGCGGGGGGSDKPTKDTFTITGKVMDSEKVPCGGIKVHLYNQTDKNPVAQMTVPSSGIYTFNNIKPGIYKIIAFSSDFTLTNKGNDYVNYPGGVESYTENITVSPYAMSTSPITNTLTYVSENGTCVFTPTVPETKKLSDGRVVVSAFYTEESKADSEQFNFYAKFKDGSISKIQGKVKGSKLYVFTEIPVATANLDSVTVGDFKVIPGKTALYFVEGAGTFITTEMVVTSSNPLFNESRYMVSADFGWFVEYSLRANEKYVLAY